MSPLKSSRLTGAKESSRPEPRRWPVPVELKKASAVSTAKLVIVLGRAYRSLTGFLEGGLTLQGISAADFAIMEALLHKGPLAASVIAAKIAQVPNAAMRLAIGRLVRRGLIRRQTNRHGSAAGRFEAANRSPGSTSSTRGTSRPSWASFRPASKSSSGSFSSGLACRAIGTSMPAPKTSAAVWRPGSCGGSPTT